MGRFRFTKESAVFMLMGAVALYLVLRFLPSVGAKILETIPSKG